MALCADSTPVLDGNDFLLTRLYLAENSYNFYHHK